MISWVLKRNNAINSEKIPKQLEDLMSKLEKEQMREVVKNIVS